MWRGIGMVVGVGGGRSDVMVVVVVLHLLCIWAFDMGAFPFLLCVSLHITTIPHGSGRQEGSARADGVLEVVGFFFAFNWGAPGRWGEMEEEQRDKLGPSPIRPRVGVLMVRFQESFFLFSSPVQTGF